MKIEAKSTTVGVVKELITPRVYTYMGQKNTSLQLALHRTTPNTFDSFLCCVTASPFRLLEYILLASASVVLPTMMSIMRRKAASPALSTKSTMSPALSWRGDMTPRFDVCPPTPQWDSLPSTSTVAYGTIPNYSSEAQIAWTAFHTCSRRMNSACVANRAQTTTEQRSWWEETSSICRNAIMLHSATLHRQYDMDTARNLAVLEDAYHVVQTMLDSLSLHQQAPIEVIPNETLLSDTSSISSTLFGDEPVREPVKRSKRLALTAMFGKMKTHLTTRESKLDVDKMSSSESMLY